MSVCLIARAGRPPTIRPTALSLAVMAVVTAFHSLLRKSSTKTQKTRWIHVLLCVTSTLPFCSQVHVRPHVLTRARTLINTICSMSVVAAAKWLVRLYTYVWSRPVKMTVYCGSIRPTPAFGTSSAPRAAACFRYTLPTHAHDCGVPTYTKYQI
eukprot:COSAG05_NODE_379_length_10567_cov_18.553687_8_plen_154_part_00